MQKRVIWLVPAALLFGGCGVLGGLVGVEDGSSTETPTENSGGEGTAGGHIASESNTTNAATTAEPTDEQLAAAAIAILTGDLHQASFDSDPPAVELGLSGPGLSAVKTRVEEWTREWFRANGYSGAADPLGQELTFRVCKLERIRLDGEADERAAGRVCGQRRNYNLHTAWADIHQSLPARVFYFEVLVGHLPEAARPGAHLRFASRLGWEAHRLPVDRGPTTFALEPTEASRWTPGQIRLAQSFVAAAGDHQGASETRAMLAEALQNADTHECRWSPVALVREPRGGGFGPPAYDPALTVRPDIAGSGGALECDEVRQIRSEPGAVQAVRRSHPEPRTVLAVEAVDGQPWQTNHNARGQATSMTRVVRLYRRVER